MRIQFERLSDFTSELAAYAAFIHERSVRWQPAAVPLGDDHPLTTIGATATALVVKSAEQWLLELVVVAGEDDLEADEGERERGTEELTRLAAELAEACGALGLTVRPGKLEVV